MAALQTIANIEAPDPSGRRSLKELSGAVGRIALAAIADAGGAEAIQDKEVGSSSGKDRRHYGQRSTGEATELARAD